MRSSSTGRAGLAALALVVAVAAPAAAATNSVTLANGADLSVTVDPLGTDGTVILPQGDTDIDVAVTGRASAGAHPAPTPNAHWTYVIDVSGSTVADCGAGLGTTLDCEKEAVRNLNQTLVANGTVQDVGITVFGSRGAVADMSAAVGQQSHVAPDDPGFATVLDSVVQGEVGQFTRRDVDIRTALGLGLHSAYASVHNSSAPSKNVVFFSDGVSTSNIGFAEGLAGMKAEGATVHAFAIGPDASCTFTYQDFGDLQDMADATGGTCTNVPDPANLPDIVEKIAGAELTSVNLTGAALDTITPALPIAGPATAEFTATATGLTSGTHQVCADATGSGPTSDPTSRQTVQACEDVHVYGFALAPDTATNELGESQEHTVTATLTGPAGMLEGRPVDFTVEGHNAGATGTCAPTSCETDANGEVTFSYEVALSPASLGSDTISATVTVDDAQGTRQVTKEWVDTTPPVAVCVPGPNPSGEMTSTGDITQNPEGFWTVSAVDDVWGERVVHVTDEGTGTVFGPYDSPTNIKYTQAVGAPSSEKAGPGSVDWQLRGQGDALVHAVDGSGNISSSMSCAVPPNHK